MTIMRTLPCLLEGRSTSEVFTVSDSNVSGLQQRLMDMMGLVFNPLFPSNAPTLWSANLSEVEQGAVVSADSLPCKKMLQDPTQALFTLPQGTTIIVRLAQEVINESEVLEHVLPDLTYYRVRKVSTATTFSTSRRTPTEVKEWKEFRSAAKSRQHSTERKFNRSDFRFIDDDEEVSNEKTLSAALQFNVFSWLNRLLRPKSKFVSYSGATVAGEPHFVYKSLPDKTRILIEVKTKWDLKCDDLVKKYNDDMRLIADGVEPLNPVWPYIQQIFVYLSLNRLRYGVLTTYDQAWFMKREGGLLLVSPSIRHCDRFPTMLQCYRHLVDLSDEDHMSPPAPLSHSLNRRHARRQGTQGIDLDELAYQELIRFKEADLGEFELLELLGAGRSGCVFRALRQDKPVALKICDLYKHPDYEDEMLSEVACYQALESLQGIYIPRLMFAGYNGGIFAVAMEMAGSPVELDTLSDADRLEIVDCLAEIHRHGILHNDIRLENILVFCENDQLQVRFIDFALSKLTSNELELEREMNSLKYLLEMD